MMLLARILLLPYYLILRFRNALYDWTAGGRPRYDIPTICVGNITMGGTGKTPHTELLIDMFKGEYRVAVISRGYGRSTSGYREVTVDDTFRTVGDEPLQIKRKFPDIRVVVDRNRNRAMEKLCALPAEERPSLVILDDAFQYRSLIPDCSILLVNYNRPIFDDVLFPFGRLRDTCNQVKRADVVIVTKYPDDEVLQSEKALWRKKLHLKGECPLLFSKMEQMPPLPVFPSEGNNRYLYSKEAVVFSGIAGGGFFKNNISRLYKVNKIKEYSDHHVYTMVNMRAIDRMSRHYPMSIVLTTEKDRQRIDENRIKDIPVSLKTRMFYVPVRVDVIPESENNYLLDEVTSNEMGMKQLKHAILCRLSSLREDIACPEK